MDNNKNKHNKHNNHNQQCSLWLGAFHRMGRQFLMPEMSRVGATSCSTWIWEQTAKVTPPNGSLIWFN